MSRATRRSAAGSGTTMRPRPCRIRPRSAKSPRTRLVASRVAPITPASCSCVSRTCRPRPKRPGVAEAGRVRLSRVAATRLQRAEREVRQPMLQLRHPLPQDACDAHGDPRVGQEEALDVRDAEPADQRVVDRLGIAVVHPLADQDHLAEHGAGLEDRQGQRLPVLRDAEHPHPPGLEDEQRPDRLRLAAEQLPAPEHGRRGHPVRLVHLGPGQVGEQVDLAQARERVRWRVGPLVPALGRSPAPR